MKSIVGNFSRRRIALLLLALILLSVAWKGYQLADAAQSARASASEVLVLVRQLQVNPGDGAALAAIGPATESTSCSLERLQAEIVPMEPLLVLARPLPEVGWLADVPDLLRFALPLSRMGAMALQPLSQPAVATNQGQDQLGRFLAAAVALGSQEAELRQQVDEAEAALARLGGREMRGPLQQVGPALAKANELIPQAKIALRLLPAIGPALGMQGPRTYLLLGQNNAELRATGGFIGSFGSITIDRGAVAKLEYGSSYAADQGVATPPPPDPLARYMGLGGWYLRDANWWPDFPASAAQVEQAWRRAGHGPVDGVIAFDMVTVDALLQSVGSLEVAGYGSVTAGNFDWVAAEQLYSRAALASASSFHEAKGAFLGATSRALVDRITTMPPARLLALTPQLATLLAEKHLLVAFKEPRLVEVANRAGWDGSIPAVDGDSLLVVDSTVSYGDSYSYVKVQDSLSLAVSDDGGQTHDLVLDYNNIYPHGLPPWVPSEMVGGDSFDPVLGKLVRTPGFWGDWLRIYLPLDARSISLDGLTDPAPLQWEFGRTVVAGYLPLAPGENRRVQVHYVIGIGQKEERADHSLYLQKQAGVACRPITITAVRAGDSSASFQGCPTRDQWVQLPAIEAQRSNGASH